jgi:proton-translocating NADH-quinone oxidoreductase chain L
MLDWFRDHPGRLYVVATLLPLAAATLLLLVGFFRNLARAGKETNPFAARAFAVLGGDKPTRLAGDVALFSLAISAALAVGGLVWFLNDASELSASRMEARWAEQVEWVHLGATPDAHAPGHVLDLGYRIDRLTALLFAMVGIVGTLIFLFSLGYMQDELKADVEDHTIHFHRRGRFGRFFFYMSLFAFSMFNLLAADNLVQVFIGWELVGVCSFFLIGFYTERKSASTAANKAFLMNRVGDAGFLVGIFVAWTQFGTVNIQDLIANVTATSGTAIPYEWWVVMGAGLFLGCMGKSAQVPLHTWLPDAMEGPTPVSALIHAATMVAAGVYFAGRCFPLFAPEVLTAIAVVGAVTLFISATIATVQYDIKRVLAWSTCSQLGYMMLALGIGAWIAALLHLITHAFFKALLFLGSGSVIHACHHEQDLRKMGGLRKKLPVTAYTMLVGVLAIAGIPFLSGWYSKDQILAQVFGRAGHGEFTLLSGVLFILPVFTALLTAFYMARLWLLAFAGEPRDHHVYDHAHESPAVMTLPLVVLALFSIGVGWGWPVWDAEASAVGHVLKAGEPTAVSQFAAVAHEAEHAHLLAGGAALLLSLGGFAVAWMFHSKGLFLAADKSGQPRPVRRFLQERWFFDQLYDALFVKPTVGTAMAASAFDKQPTDGKTSAEAFDLGTLDGLLNAAGDAVAATGNRVREANHGRLRNYVLVLGLTAVGLLGILSYLIK